MKVRLWQSTSGEDWRGALRSYEAVIARQSVRGALQELDDWYRLRLPAEIAAQKPRHVTLEQLVQITKWKMSRGVWRARNLELVRGNAPSQVAALSEAALARAPHATVPLTKLSELAGVGPATASAVLAAAEPEIYPFLDDIVAAQISGLGPVKYTLGFYARYAEALRQRAKALGGTWNATLVERALWAHAGGKKGGLA
jgi:hypothetical protein